ncbi:MAG: hypothetical protein QG671_808 [Actinomycetota bacterium]|nr:hypothetical protein [Actinomycetota bacterium]
MMAADMARTSPRTYRITPVVGTCQTFTRTPVTPPPLLFSSHVLSGNPPIWGVPRFRVRHVDPGSEFPDPFPAVPPRHRGGTAARQRIPLRCVAPTFLGVRHAWQGQPRACAGPCHDCHPSPALR